MEELVQKMRPVQDPIQSPKKDARIIHENIQNCVRVGLAATNSILKDNQVSWCQFMIKKFEDGHTIKVWDLIIGDGTSIYQYDPETKRRSSVFKQQSSSLPRSGPTCEVLTH